MPTTKKTTPKQKNPPKPENKNQHEIEAHTHVKKWSFLTHMIYAMETTR